jgi:hypothetical protein
MSLLSMYVPVLITYNIIVCLALLFPDKINLSLGRQYNSVGKFDKFVGVPN